MAFGAAGIFVGSVVLAVSHTLLDEWVHESGTGLAPLAPGASAGPSKRENQPSPEPVA